MVVVAVEPVDGSPVGGQPNRRSLRPLAGPPRPRASSLFVREPSAAAQQATTRPAARSQPRCRPQQPVAARILAGCRVDALTPSPSPGVRSRRRRTYRPVSGSLHHGRCRPTHRFVMVHHLGGSWGNPTPRPRGRAARPVTRPRRCRRGRYPRFGSRRASSRAQEPTAAPRIMLAKTNNSGPTANAAG